jgi:hypothetical protein
VLFSRLDPSDAGRESVSDAEMKGLERAILPVSAASLLGAVVGGQKVHVQDQEAHTRELRR